jgi:hypothetical protein
MSLLLWRFPDAPIKIGLEKIAANLRNIGEGGFSETIDKFADYLQGQMSVTGRSNFELDSSFGALEMKRRQGGLTSSWIRGLGS